MITVAITQALTLAACLAVYLGLEWIGGNQGLHPILAGSIALVAVLTPYAAHSWIYNNDDEEELI